MVFCLVYKVARLLAGHSPRWISFWTVQHSGKVKLSHQVKVMLKSSECRDNELRVMGQRGLDVCLSVAW